VFAGGGRLKISFLFYFVHNDKLAIVLEVNHVRVDRIYPSRSFREADSIAWGRVPAADCSELAVVVVTGPVVQHRSVVYERVQVSAVQIIAKLLQQDARQNTPERLKVGDLQRRGLERQEIAAFR